MKFRYSLLSVFVVLSSHLFAQNIVINGSFEELSDKPRNPGEVFLAKPWTGGTQAMPDIYSPSAKDDAIDAPDNAYGSQKPKDGKNYAGILMYSNREAEPRSYLTQKMKYPMLAGEYYCVKFHISFADLSKYAINNIGCYISHDSVGSETDLMLSYKPQVIHSTNRIFEKQWDWEDICRIYIAEGGEQFITIGNFESQEGTQTQSVKRPREFTQTQLRDGYYFIDHITVTPNATPANCKCEPGSFAFANLEKEAQTFETAEEDVPDKVIVGTTEKLPDGKAPASTAHKDVVIGFGLGKSNLDAGANAKLNEALKKLKGNENLKVKLVGHVDDSETVIKDLGKDRINQVHKYLLSKGIDNKRIETQDVFDKEPIDSSGSNDKRQLNMVVEMKFSE